MLSIIIIMAAMQQALAPSNFLNKINPNNITASIINSIINDFNQ